MLTIAKTFNLLILNFFVKIRPSLASKIPKSDKKFEAYINKANTQLEEKSLTEDKSLEAFKSLKISKAPGFNEIDVNVINQV